MRRSSIRHSESLEIILVLLVCMVAMPLSRGDDNESRATKEARDREFAEYPKNQTLRKFIGLRRDLEKFKKDCGRYPYTREGLKALVESVPGLPYKPEKINEDLYYGKRVPVGESYPGKADHWTPPKGTFSPRDGWDKRIRYRSDGKTYRIEASHGLVLTDKDPAPTPPDAECIDC